jgi:hypothetical protein
VRTDHLNRWVAHSGDAAGLPRKTQLGRTDNHDAFLAYGKLRPIRFGVIADTRPGADYRFFGDDRVPYLRALSDVRSR